jgi:hypothetical protein
MPDLSWEKREMKSAALLLCEAGEYFLPSRVLQ